MSKFIRKINPNRDSYIIPYICLNDVGDYVVAVDRDGYPMRVLSKDFYEDVELPESLRKEELIERINSVDKHTVMGSEGDAVQHPSHYTHGKYETIDVIEDVTSGYDDGFVSYAVGNSLKYLARGPFKHNDGGLEDLKKCRRYLDFAIDRLERSL